MSDKFILGQETPYSDQYSPELLVPIARDESRRSWLAGGALPFSGKDLWSAYELSWLDPRGKPVVAIADFVFDAASVNIVESKSFKYYLNSFNQSQFADVSELVATLERDLGAVAQGGVTATIYAVDDYHSVDRLTGTCVDALDIDVNRYSPTPSLLSLGEGRVSGERLYSHLLKSNCPVTGQPDWASVWIEYSGARIEPSSFLAYVISYRQHQGFHESCVEGMFVDIMAQCKPDALSVYARYTRRGGLDINPFRSNCGAQVPALRLARQ